MAKIIAFANHKGGVGKTSSVSAIGTLLATRGNRVLLVDLDTQANLTRCHVDGFPKRLIYHALREQKDIPVLHVEERLDLVPSGLEMAGIELQMSGYMQRENTLKNLLHEVEGNYDYILLDCPPSLGLITVNALVAANHMVVPMLADTMSFYGLDMIEEIRDMISKGLNPDIRIDAIFFTKYDPRLSLSSAIKESVENIYHERLLKSYVRVNTKIGESPMFHEGVLNGDTDGRSTEDYNKVLDEILARIA